MKIFLLTLIFSSLIVLTTKSQTYTWTNGGGDNDFENVLNWTPPPPFGFPSFGENATFDGSVSNDNCILPNPEDFVTLLMMSNYTGTVDASGFDLNLTSISLQGGTLLAPTTTLTIIGNLLRSGTAVFNAPVGSWLSYNLNSSTLRSISGTFNFQNLSIGTSGAGNRTINFNAGTSTCTALALNGAANPMAYRGTINVTDQLTIAGTAVTAAPNNTGTILFNGAGSKTITGSGTALQNPIGNITFNTSGDVNMSGNLTIARSTSGAVLTGGTWSVANIGSFTAGSSLVTMRGGTITAGNTSTSQAFFDNLTIQTGSTTVFSGNSFVNLKGNLTHDGTLTTNTSLIRLSGSGAQAINGTSTLTTINALEINNSGTKTLSHAVNLLDSVRIATGVLASGGNLTLKSTSALKGRIAQISGGGSITGNITVETFAPGGLTDWSNLGPSGVSGLSVASWEGQIPMTCSLCPNDEVSAGGYFVSVQGWDETAAAGSPLAYIEQNYNSPLSPGIGYWIYLGDGAVSTSTLLWTVSGPAVTGVQPISLTNSGVGNGDGYNLISNPYPSPISWSKLRNGNALVDNAIYVYNADCGCTSTWNGVVTSPGGSGANDVIPMGQGFYVRANNGAGATLLAQETNKIPSNTSANPLLKTTNNTPQVFRLRLDGFDASYDDAVLLFEPSASPSFDTEWDAHKVFTSPGYLGYPGTWSSRTSIFSQYNNVDYAINTIPPVNNQNLVMPIGVRVYQTGQYTISPVSIENLPAEVCVTLNDKVTNITHDLRSGAYVCSINDTTQAARFVLTICSTNTPPVGINEIKSNPNAVSIFNDATGAMVNLDFAQSTKATISVTNILGQKVMKDKTVNGTKESVHIDLNANNEILFVTVTTDKERITKKIIR